MLKILPKTLMQNVAASKRFELENKSLIFLAGHEIDSIKINSFQKANVIIRNYGKNPAMINASITNFT